MALFEQIQNRQPGEPRMPRVPGAPMTPSTPHQFNNPPAAASAPIGRPANPAPPMSGGAGAALPVTQAARPTLPSSSPRTPRPDMPGRSGSVVVNNTDFGVDSGAPQAAQPIVQIDRIPSRGELAMLPEGMRVMTPYGEMNRDGTITPTPELQDAYQKATVQRRQDFGPHPWNDDPNAPHPPAVLGKRMFNPFTGRWKE